MFKLGHVLIKVTNLEEAVHNYKQLGFTITMGGLPGKSQNALIYLADGTFIELYDTSMGKMDPFILKLLKLMAKINPDKANRYLNYVTSEEGMNDFAFDSIVEEGFDSNIAFLESKGLDFLKPTKKQRVDASGCKRKWRLYFPKDYRLPFFMGPYEPKVTLNDKQMSHDNGALGIQKLIIEVPDYEYFVGFYKKLTSCFTVGEEISAFYFGTSWIQIEKSKIYQIKSISLVGNSNKEFPSELSHKTVIKMLPK